MMGHADDYPAADLRPATQVDQVHAASVRYPRGGAESAGDWGAGAVCEAERVTSRAIASGIAVSPSTDVTP